MWKPWVRSLGHEHPLEKEIATHSSTLACKILWTEEPDRLQSMGLQGVRHDWATSLTYLLKSCPALCDPMNCSTPGFPALHHLPEFTETHVHWVHDAIQHSHPLSPLLLCPQFFPASGSFLMSQLFPSGGQSTGVTASTSVPPKKSQGWSPSEWTGWISLQSKGLSRVFSNTTVQKHQFFGAQLSL